MGISIDNVLGLHENAVKLRARRIEMLATNIANADTPGYKARDFNFRQALSDAQSSGRSSFSLQATQPGHFSSGKSRGFEMMYSTPLQPSIDGNTVDLHREKAKFTQNAMEQQVSLTFLDRKLKGLVKAIRGE